MCHHTPHHRSQFFYDQTIESEFKPYLETRRTKGHLIMKGNPLRCGCDVKWILNSNFQWDNLLQGATCTNGKNLLEVIIWDPNISIDNIVFHLLLLIFLVIQVIWLAGERDCAGETLPSRDLSSLPFRLRSPLRQGGRQPLIAQLSRELSQES